MGTGWKTLGYIIYGRMQLMHLLLEPLLPVKQCGSVIYHIIIMFQIIIGCVLANILTIAIIGLALYLVYLDILPSLKQMGFLDTSARNPDIIIAGITLALQFGNALPKYITGCKNITVVNCATRWAHPRAVA